MPEETANISENLITMLGLEELPEEERRAFLAEATSLVEKRLMLNLLEGLNEEQARQAETLSNDPNRLMAFLMESRPDIDDVLAKEIENVKQDLLAGQKELTE